MRIAFVFLALLALAGCDILERSPEATVVEGVVVDAATGAPISGIQVLLSQGSSGFGSYPTRDRDVTDTDGRFSLSYTTSARSALPVFVNDCTYGDDFPSCYDERYGSLTVSVMPQERHSVRYELTPVAP